MYLGLEYCQSSAKRYATEPRIDARGVEEASEQAGKEECESLTRSPPISRSCRALEHCLARPLVHSLTWLSSYSAPRGDLLVLAGRPVLGMTGHTGVPGAGNELHRTTPVLIIRRRESALRTALVVNMALMVPRRRVLRRSGQ